MNNSCCIFGLLYIFSFKKKQFNKPSVPTGPVSTWGSHAFDFGKFKGSSFESVVTEQKSYTNYLLRTVGEGGMEKAGEEPRRISQGMMHFAVSHPCGDRQ